MGVKTSKIYAAMAKQRDGYENIGCLERDIRNQLDKEHRLALEAGDAKAMLEYFIYMQEENPNFFYAIDLDEEHRLRNVFWVDAKGRDDYQDFGDVVSFDTTYITNKYKMPFAPFIGVNNHFQSTLLGCALLADESSTTFTWLMKTWVRAMGGKPPNAIITDQDKAMKVAIASVFHDTRHRSWTREKFEERWQEMIRRFELVEDEWLQTLYEEREHWVPVYMKDAFFGGMSTTQRSESINSFFDKYVGKKTSLKEFVEQYKVVIQDRKEAEKQADFNSWQKQPSLKTPSPFEKQMSMIYTHEVFKKFQVEILGISGCYSSKDGGDGQITTFKVHTMATLQGLGVFSIPSHYILRRWTKDVRNEYDKSGVMEEVQCKKQRYDQLLQQANQLFEEGSLCYESYNFVSHALEETLKQCVNINHSLQIGGVNEIQDVGKENVCPNKLPMVPIFDPKVSKTKGAPKRIKSGVEKGQRKCVNKKLRKVKGKLEVQNELKTQNDIVRNLSQQRQDVQGKTTSNAQGFCNSYVTQDGKIRRSWFLGCVT
ncbi:hypothetical protein SLEP1_g34922 [Rubroshorea leprosula]|uniref:Protein FAR1-RELATED SEQUENCE n=1 Tax=Rubroshorea leprosula TaxID=152421 RepID=A0AAV5KLI3_9ROSI|nr:hypothetical protein SLEP1_g34922 [Rubroshorea leprosula]